MPWQAAGQHDLHQVRLLKRFTTNVLLIYDADRAGISAAVRGIDILLEQEMNVRVLLLPEGDDPDSYVKSKGKTGFEEYIKENQQDFVDFKLTTLHMELDFSDPQQKTQAIHEVAATLSKIPDMVKMALYLELAAKKLGVSLDIMQTSVNRALAEKARLEKRSEGFKQVEQQQTLNLQNNTQQVVAPVELAELPFVAQEYELMRLLFNYPDKPIKVEEEEWPLIDF